MIGLPARYFWSVLGSQLARTHIARKIDAARTGFVRLMEQCFHDAIKMSSILQRIAQRHAPID
jgi:hypothetical protein